MSLREEDIMVQFKGTHILSHQQEAIQEVYLERKKLVLVINYWRHYF